MAEFDFAQIVNWLGSDAVVSGKVQGFRQDSRNVGKGDLFFAIKGEKVDGHDYLNEVAGKGAVGAVAYCAADASPQEPQREEWTGAYPRYGLYSRASRRG